MSEQVVEDTLPKLLRRNYRKYGDKRGAIRKKDLGIWWEMSWKDYYETIKWLSLGLISLGFQRGDSVSIIGDNDPELFAAEYAAQAAGGQAVNLFIDYVPSEVKYIVGHSDSSFVFAKDQEQCDKLLEIKDELPLVKKVIYWEAKGLMHYDEPILIDFRDVVALGKEYEKTHPNLFDENIDKGKADDLALLEYTSGTTAALPKSAMVTYDNLLSTIQSWLSIEPWDEKDNYLSFVSPAWATEQIFGVCACQICGATVHFPEEPETVQENTREICPQMLLYSSRLWEEVVRTVLVKVGDADWFKRGLFDLFLPVGYKVAGRKMAGKKVNPFWRIIYAIGYLAVFRPLLDKIGLLKTKRAYTGGSALGPDAYRFLHAIGINVKQAYGATEVGVATFHRDGDIRPDSIGQPLPIFEVKISEEGELLIKGRGVFPGYYKDPEKTAQALTDGWFHTGDAAYIDKDGHVIYVDRVKDLKKLATGAKFSPLFVENALKFSRYVKDAIVTGDNEEYVGVIINMDYNNVGKWAEKHGILYTTFADLSQNPEVYDLIQKDVEKVNRTIPEQTRIRKYCLLHKEFDPDEAELTRTRKLRRTFMEEKYKDLMDGLYGDKDEVIAQAEVKYRDGRKRVISTPVRIRDMGSKSP